MQQRKKISKTLKRSNYISKRVLDIDTNVFNIYKEIKMNEPIEKVEWNTDYVLNTWLKESAKLFMLFLA